MRLSFRLISRFLITLLPLGLFLDVFSFEGLYELLLALSMLLFFKNKLGLLRESFSLSWLSWLTIPFLFFLIGLFYGDIYFNLKLMIAVLIGFLFSQMVRLGYINISDFAVYFSLGVSILAIFYFSGLFNSYVRFSKGRLFFFEENPNSLSTRVGLSIILSTYLILEDRRTWTRLVSIVNVIVSFPFLLLFGSKGSFILTAIFSAVVFFFSKSLSLRVKLLLGGLSLVVGLRFIVPMVVMSVVGERFISDGTELGTREVLWKLALEKIYLTSPMGIGESEYVRRMEFLFGQGLDTHNLFLYLLVTAGPIGVVLFVVPLLRMIWFIYRSSDNKKTIMMALLLFMIMLMAKTGGIITFLLMWLVLGLLHGSIKTQHR